MPENWKKGQSPITRNLMLEEALNLADVAHNDTQPSQRLWTEVQEEQHDDYGCGRGDDFEKGR